MANVILIVEDCDETVAALEIALQKHFGCRIEHVTDGAAALAAFARMAGSVFAIFTDLNLPEVDGWHVILKIRQSGSGSHLPIIAMSADPDPQARVRALEAGADAFVAKPYSPFEMCRCLEKILHDDD